MCVCVCVYTCVCLCVSFVKYVYDNLHHSTISLRLLADKEEKVGTIACITDAINQLSASSHSLKASITSRNTEAPHIPRSHTPPPPGNFLSHPCVFDPDLRIHSHGLELGLRDGSARVFQPLPTVPAVPLLSLPSTYLGNWRAWKQDHKARTTRLPHSIFPIDVVAPPFPCLAVVLEPPFRGFPAVLDTLTPSSSNPDKHHRPQTTDHRPPTTDHRPPATTASHLFPT